MGKVSTPNERIEDVDLGLSLRELASLGLTPRSLEAAIDRAKHKTRRRGPIRSGQGPRPRRIESNPELDRWFD